MTTRLYGIPNCDTVRKARSWCDANGVDHEFVDFRAHPVGPERLRVWIDALGDGLLNRRSTSWKRLTQAERDTVTDEASVTALTALLDAHPTLIKRPVLEHNGAVAVGFNAGDYAARFGH